MTTVPIAELQASLSEYVARARSGEEVLVTDGGTRVARLVPPSPATDSEGILANLIRTGQARPAEHPMPAEFFEQEPPVADPEGYVLKALLEERESGW